MKEKLNNCKHCGAAGVIIETPKEVTARCSRLCSDKVQVKSKKLGSAIREWNEKN